jgi:glycosyltransferase involved in cell wall biosynthesis
MEMNEHDRAEPERNRPKRHPPGQPHAQGEEAYDELALEQPQKEHPQKEQKEEDPTREVHLSVEHLHGPEEVPYGEDELVVVCLVRDGRPYVKSFVEHYLSLGAKHVFFLDNGSTDGTVEALEEYDDNVTVLRSTLPFKRYRWPFKQYLMGRFGRKGRWVLYADIDELFDYPYSNVVSLGSLLGYLGAKSCTAVVAHMLDMFPEEPLSGRAVDPDEPLKERHRFYDVSDLRRRSIKEHPRLRNNTYKSDDIEAFRGRVRRTVYGATTVMTERNITLESDEIEVFSGGIRETIFGNTALLTKFPLVFLDGRVKPMDGSAHWVDNAKIADLTCVLYHYKFLDGYFHDQAAQAVREGQYGRNSALYKKYLKVLDGNPALQIKQESSRELRSVDDLVEDGFLVTSEDYMVLVYEQEERKRDPADGRDSGHRSAPGGDPCGAPGDQGAALRRARARAKVESLRARRLERQLDQLSEQNRREVDKLATKLARVREKNRKLRRFRRQLRSIKVSRSWRLLNKLGRLRARVAGRKR